MLPRRTSIATSTIRIPPNAVTDAAWPDGNDFEDSSACSSCHSGRARPTSSLTTLVRHRGRDHHADGEDRRPAVAAERASATATTARHDRHAERCRRRPRRPGAVPISQPESTAQSAPGRRGRRTASTGPQPWTTASVTSPNSSEGQQRPAQEHEAGAVEHGRKYDGPAEPGTGERRPSRPVQSRVSRAGATTSLDAVIDPRILRDDPDRVRAAQAKRGLSDAVVDEALAADDGAPPGDRRLRGQAGRAEDARQADPAGPGRREAGAAGPHQGARRRGEGRRGRADRGRGGLAGRRSSRSPTSPPTQAPAGGEDDFVVLETVGTPRDFAAEGFEPRDHIELGRILGAIDIERGAKVSGSRFYFLTGVGAQLELALVNLAMEQARDAGFTQVIAPSLVRPRAMEGTGFLGQAADDVYRIEGEDLYLVGTSEVPMAAYHSDEILDAAVAAAALRGVQPLLPQGGRLARQGHPGHHPGALVRQGRDVRLHDRSRSPTPSTSGCWSGRRSSSTSSSSPTASSTSPPATSGCRRCASSTARPGSRPRAGTASSPRPPTAPSSRPAASTSAAGSPEGTRPDRDPQRHPVRHDPHDRRDPRDPPAGRRVGHRAAGAAPAHGWPRGAEARP